MKKFYTLLRFSLILIFSLTLFSKNSSAAYTYKGTRIISLAGDTAGTYVRIAVPSFKRYSCGAPIAIYMFGGFGADGMLGSLFDIANYGFIVIQFNYPGGGKVPYKSGGTFDNRGPNCLKAAKDVMRFAMGEITDRYGNYLDYYTGTKNPLYNNLGLIGGSNGGCQQLVTMGLYPNELANIAWISFFESPVGEGMLNADAGKPWNKTAPVYTNTAYQDSTGVYDWSKLRFAPDTLAYKLKKDVIKGLLYFDLNGNNTFERGIDYDLVGRFNTPYSKKYFYSNQVTMKAYEMGYYPPANISIYFADSTQTKNFWSLRDGGDFIDDYLQVNPSIKVMYLARRDSDHITSAPDHPEVINAYQKFALSPTAWFKLNPDRSYLEYVTGTLMPTAPDNDANAVINHVNIRTMDLPGELFTYRYYIHYASTLEMADRTMNNDWSPNLPGLLTTTCPSARDEDAEINDDALLYPNPANTEINIQINANAVGTATIRIFDALGKEVMAPVSMEVSNIFHLAPIDISNLSAGNYFVRIDAPGFVHTLQFTRE